MLVCRASTQLPHALHQEECVTPKGSQAGTGLLVDLLVLVLRLAFMPYPCY